MLVGLLSICREEVAPLQKGEYTCKYQSSYIMAVEHVIGHHYNHWFRAIGCASPEMVRLESSMPHFILSIRDLPSSAVPGPIQFTTLMESCGTSWLQLSSSIMTTSQQQKNKEFSYLSFSVEAGGGGGGWGVLSSFCVFGVFRLKCLSVAYTRRALGWKQYLHHCCYAEKWLFGSQTNWSWKSHIAASHKLLSLTLAPI